MSITMDGALDLRDSRFGGMADSFNQLIWGNKRGENITKF